MKKNAPASLLLSRKSRRSVTCSRRSYDAPLCVAFYMDPTCGRGRLIQVSINQIPKVNRSESPIAGSKARVGVWPLNVHLFGLEAYMLQGTNRRARRKHKRRKRDGTNSCLFCVCCFFHHIMRTAHAHHNARETRRGRPRPPSCASEPPFPPFPPHTTSKQRSVKQYKLTIKCDKGMVMLLTGESVEG